LVIICVIMTFYIYVCITNTSMNQRGFIYKLENNTILYTRV